MDRLPLIFLTLSLFHCSTESFDPDRDRADEDLGPFVVEADSEFQASPCDGVLVDHSGRLNPDGTPIERVANRLGDPFAKAIYQNAEEGCPLSYKEIVDKLRAQTSPDDCVPKVNQFSDNPNPDGFRTHVVSETAQFDDVGVATYRAVTQRECEGEEGEFSGRTDIWFSTFGYHKGLDNPELAIEGSGYPEGVEVMAFDPSEGTNGVFNYYKEVRGEMRFFGNSLDMVERGAEGPNLTDVRGCANCHTGGGLIMKELESPWLHWEGDISTQGDEVLITNRPELGDVDNGITLENKTIDENMIINRSRYDRLKESGQVKKLLAPLFCPIEVNINANGDASFINNRMVWDKDLGTSASIQTRDFDSEESDAYEAMKPVINSRVPGTSEQDTVIGFTFFHRSAADSHFVELLHEGHDPVVDKNFVDDVLMVDFTRPVFSDDRCDLLALAPQLSSDEMNPSAIRDGFIDNIQAPAPELEQLAQSPAAQQLLMHLEASASGESFDYGVTRRRYLKACEERAEAERVEVAGQSLSALAVDFVKLRSLQRNVAFDHQENLGVHGSALKPLSIMEFEQTMATDDIAVSPGASPEDPMSIDPRARLDAESCQLVPEYVARPPARIDSSVEGWGDACESDFGEGGVCINTDVEACEGGSDDFTLLTGKCDGGDNIRCCITFVDGEDFPG